MQVLENNSHPVRNYIEYMFKSPLATWWAVGTFAVELFFNLFSETVVSISKGLIIIYILILSFSLFIIILIPYKGWVLFHNLSENIEVLQIVRIENEQIFLLRGLRMYKEGSILGIYRIIEGIEISIGFIEVIHQKKDGTVQAKAVWISPVHMRDIETHELTFHNLKIYQTIKLATLSRWIDSQAQAEVESLMKHGRET